MLQHWRRIARLALQGGGEIAKARNRFFLRTYGASGGTVTEDSRLPVFHVGATPSAVLDLAGRHNLSVADRCDTPFVFDKSLLSVASKVEIPERTKLLGPGHPLFEAVIEWAKAEARDAFAKGAILIDPNATEPRRMWLARSVVEDSRHEQRKRTADEQLSVVSTDGAELQCASPANLLNCVPPEGVLALPDVPRKSSDEVQMWVYENLTEKQVGRVRAQRKAECDLRREYVENTFSYLILEIQDELNELNRLQLFGEDTGDERAKLQKHLDDLKQRRTDRLEDLDLMLKLTADLPFVVTSGIILPSPEATGDGGQPPRSGVPMRRDDEVERIALEVSMDCERRRGWTPFDVSQDGEHYDVRSESPTGEKRFIEVKGRARSGAIILTGPELDKLRQLGERAFLYIVTHCKSDQPKLRLISDPVHSLTPDMLYRQVQYVVNEGDWSAHGEVVHLQNTGEERLA